MAAAGARYETLVLETTTTTKFVKVRGHCQWYGSMYIHRLRKLHVEYIKLSFHCLSVLEMATSYALYLNALINRSALFFVILKTEIDLADGAPQRHDRVLV